MMARRSERVGNRAAHQQIAERRNAFIERQHGLHLGGSGEHLEARIGGELRKTLRRRIVGKCIDIARHQRGISRGRIGDEFEGDLAPSARAGPDSPDCAPG